MPSLPLCRRHTRHSLPCAWWSTVARFARHPRRPSQRTKRVDSRHPPPTCPRWRAGRACGHSCGSHRRPWAGCAPAALLVGVPPLWRPGQRPPGGWPQRCHGWPRSSKVSGTTRGAPTACTLHFLRVITQMRGSTKGPTAPRPFERYRLVRSGDECGRNVETAARSGRGNPSDPLPQRPCVAATALLTGSLPLLPQCTGGALRFLVASSPTGE